MTDERERQTVSRVFYHDGGSGEEINDETPEEPSIISIVP